MSVFLEEASAIGDRLARTAVVHQGRCNWLTRTIPYQASTDARDRFPEVMPLNPSVYSGTAGLALYLARLWRFTDRPEHRATAVAALRHAVRHAWYANESAVGNIGARWRFGFYLGTLGIAWTAHEVALTLGEPLFERDARRILRRLAGTLPKPKESDLMFGAAGGVPALLDLDRAGLPDAFTLAERLGKDLVAAAQRQPGVAGVSWKADYAGERPNLTGLSHGTSGMALALAELYAATRDATYLDVSRQAVEYERGYYNPEERNWPNFQGTLEDGLYPCSTSWCHGAPGIGLARSAISRHWSDAQMRAEMDAAAATTRRFSDRELHFPGKDFMLCHGVAGNLECLWAVDEARGRDGALGEMKEVAQQAVLTYGHPATGRWGSTIEWPLGVTSGTYPTLVTGLAGIGHWLLRLHTGGRLPTVLLPARPWRPGNTG